ncbi:MAG: hypothetical protein KVP17_003282 [Porospora cf. gigantea B]|uniref:uncharacterized protein n=1 Tax=Porospora cf. gigantea B TaxID=2853592 RepID=UPI00357187CE|nr:MAG: hypothetical protein KVP17_003282 [Porospora cf. gigantea B]
MGNCCDSNDIDDTAGRTGVPNEDVYVDAPFGGGGGTLSADVDPVVDKDPVGYMSGDYLSAVASIGKGAYLLYDTLQAGKFEIHYRNSPPPQTAIEQKIVAFGEFIEGETNIADRRFRRNESEVTKTQVTVSLGLTPDAAKLSVRVLSHCGVRSSVLPQENAAEARYGW